MALKIRGNNSKCTFHEAWELGYTVCEKNELRTQVI